MFKKLAITLIIFQSTTLVASDKRICTSPESENAFQYEVNSKSVIVPSSEYSTYLLKFPNTIGTLKFEHLNITRYNNNAISFWATVSTKPAGENVNSANFILAPETRSEYDLSFYYQDKEESKKECTYVFKFNK